MKTEKALQLIKTRTATNGFPTEQGERLFFELAALGVRVWAPRGEPTRFSLAGGGA